MPEENAYLGSGWSFPPTFDKATQRVEMTEGFEDINRSLEIIITTRLGERIMRPDFGSNLEYSIFDSMNVPALSFIQNVLKTAITYHEARIDVETIDLNFDAPKGTLWINIYYKVRNANSRFNFVYPYYIEEANTLI